MKEVRKIEDVLYTVNETAKLLKTNTNYVYELIRKGFLPALKLGSYKIRRVALLKFLKANEGKDLTDLNDIKDLQTKEGEETWINKREKN